MCTNPGADLTHGCDEIIPSLAKANLCLLYRVFRNATCALSPTLPSFTRCLSRKCTPLFICCSFQRAQYRPSVSPKPSPLSGLVDDCPRGQAYHGILLERRRRRFFALCLLNVIANHTTRSGSENRCTDTDMNRRCHGYISSKTPLAKVRSTVRGRNLGYGERGLWVFYESAPRCVAQREGLR